MKAGMQLVKSETIMLLKYKIQIVNFIKCCANLVYYDIAERFGDGTVGQ